MSSQTWRDEICRKSLWAFKLSRHSPHTGTGQIWSWKSLEFEWRVWRVWLQEFAEIHKNSVQPCGKWTSVDIANYLFIFLFFLKHASSSMLTSPCLQRWWEATSSAFAALREDGTVHTWGLPHKGGDSSSVQDQPGAFTNSCWSQQ